MNKDMALIELDSDSAVTEARLAGHPLSYIIDRYDC